VKLTLVTSSAASVRGQVFVPSYSNWSVDSAAASSEFGHGDIPAVRHAAQPRRNHVAASAVIPAVDVLSTMKPAAQAPPLRGAPR